MNFEQLKNYYQSRLEVLNDSILIGAVSHLNDMCLVADSEYIAAIERFDELVYSNQDNDISFYNEINALTTALLIEDNVLSKGVSAKYKTADNSEFITKLNILTNKRNGNINIDEPGTTPDSYMLYNNYPNPFNPSTTIKYDMPASLNPSQGLTLQKVVLKVYDILGKEVVTLVDEEKPAGRYEVTFDASKLASGVYIYKLQSGEYISSKKMMLLK
ncbi:MAG: T9SS type A sorting domain-containing protein [Ignavibacteriaceae bacterium]|jgi:hypothetical protein|nr:T9SS type A sorting domain-containing protein [Ignavibacteriaceae bacterium]